MTNPAGKKPAANNGDSAKPPLPRSARPKNQCQQAEQAIAHAEQTKQDLSDQAAAAFGRGDNDEGTRLSQELHAVADRIEELYNQWMLAQEALAALTQDADSQENRG